MLLNVSAFRVFWFLVIRSDKTNRFEGGSAVIARELRMGKQMVLDALRYLNDNGYIRSDTVSHVSVVHWVSPDLVWKTKKEKKKLCGFIEDVSDRVIAGFSSFVQVNYSLEMRDRMLACLADSPRAFILFIFLLLNVDYHMELEVSLKDISAATGLSIRSLNRYSQYLQSLGFIRVYASRGTNGYQIYSDIACRSNKTDIGEESILFTMKGGEPND